MPVAVPSRPPGCQMSAVEKTVCPFWMSIDTLMKSPLVPPLRASQVRKKPADGSIACAAERLLICGACGRVDTRAEPEGRVCFERRRAGVRLHERRLLAH